jgi:hypothetical protein
VSGSDFDVAVEALFRYWRAALRRDLGARSKRPVSETEVQRYIIGLGPFRLFEPVLQLIRRREGLLGKPYTQWSQGERAAGARCVAEVLDGIRARDLERRRGRPKKPSATRGIIASEIANGELAAADRMKREYRHFKRRLPRLVEYYKLGKWAKGQERYRSRTPTPTLAEIEAEAKRFSDEVNIAASDAEAVRVLLNGTGLESKATALKQHLYRRRKHLG